MKIVTIKTLLAVLAFIMPTHSLFADETIADVSDSKFSEYAHPDSFITVPKLQTLMANNNNVVVIGALNPSKAEKGIKGAFRLWRPDYSDANRRFDVEGMRNSKPEMEKLLSSFGVTPESIIVVYASKLNHDAGRLFWQIKMLGHQDVRYLDGGLSAWTEAGFLTSDKEPKAEVTQYKATKEDTSALANMDMVLDAINDEEWVIIDTRSDKEYDGTITLEGAYGGGRIPNSVHINWSNALNDDTSLKSIDELNQLYSDVINNKKVIVYCQSGVRSAHSTMVLKEILGAKEVYNYDGSWIEWSHAHYKLKTAEIKIEGRN